MKWVVTRDIDIYVASATFALIIENEVRVGIEI